MKWTLDQAKEHPLWRGLTDKERRFFELLSENNLDEAAAAAGAFELAPQSVNIRLNQIRAGIRTGFIYRAMMGFALPSREELAAQFWQIAQTTRDEARKERAMRETAKLLGFERLRGKDTEAPEPPEAPGHSKGDEPDLSEFQE